MRDQNLSGDAAVNFFKKKLGRELNQFENDMANYPRQCAICNVSDCQDKLKTCKQCFCVAFCPDHLEKGQGVHEKWCKKLRTAAEDYKNEQTLGHQV